MNKDLSPLQEKILNIYHNNDNVLPSFRKLAKMIEVSSINTVAYHINELKRKGYFGLEGLGSGIVKFTIQNLLNFESKEGVYVLLNGKIPFYVNESENIKNHILENVFKNNNSPVLDLIKNNPNKINIAYNLINEPEKRAELKNHLLEFYPKQGIKIF